jgi:hypothetical protein
VRQSLASKDVNLEAEEAILQTSYDRYTTDGVSTRCYYS